MSIDLNNNRFWLLEDQTEVAGAGDITLGNAVLMDYARGAFNEYDRNFSVPVPETFCYIDNVTDTYAMVIANERNVMAVLPDRGLVHERLEEPLLNKRMFADASDGAKLSEAIVAYLQSLSSHDKYVPATFFVDAKFALAADELCSMGDETEVSRCLKLLSRINPSRAQTPLAHYPQRTVMCRPVWHSPSTPRLSALIEHSTSQSHAPLILQLTQEPNLGHAHEFLKAFLHKLLDRETQHKIGVILQLHNQTTESECLSNTQTTPAFRFFLNLLGAEVQLADHKGYLGGLNNQVRTDIIERKGGGSSYYVSYCGHEVMYHVSTMLPFTSSDPLHLERKRHIGNDNVVIIFQDCTGVDTTLSPGQRPVVFSPDMISTQMVMIYIVVLCTRDSNSSITFTTRLCYRNLSKKFCPLRFGNKAIESISELLYPPAALLTLIVDEEALSSYSSSAPPLASIDQFKRAFLIKVLNSSMTVWNTPFLFEKLKRMWTEDIKAAIKLI